MAADSLSCSPVTLAIASWSCSTIGPSCIISPPRTQPLHGGSGKYGFVQFVGFVLQTIEIFRMQAFELHQVDGALQITDAGNLPTQQLGTQQCGADHQAGAIGCHYQFFGCLAGINDVACRQLTQGGFNQCVIALL